MTHTHKGWYNALTMAQEIVEAVKEAVDAEVVATVTEIVPARPGPPPHAGKHLIESRGQVDTILWLKAQKWSNRAIAKHLGCSARSVDRFVARPDFEAMLAAREMEQQARVQDALDQRVLNVAVEAMETRVLLMRDRKTPPALRDKIAAEIVEWAKTLRDEGASGNAGLLTAMAEMVQKVRGNDGVVTEKRLRVSGSPAQVAAAAADAGMSTNPAPGRPAAGPDRTAG